MELVTARSRGNPFYVEELLNFIRGEGIDLQDEAALRTLDAPGSLHSLILSRIDTLDESPRRTVKVASVLGRTFLAPTLPGVYPGARAPGTPSAPISSRCAPPISSPSTGRSTRPTASATSSRRR